MLLAGINFMGAIQDALTGFPLTAGARILEAILATAGVIAGVSGGLTVGRMLGVDLGRLDPGLRVVSDLPVMASVRAITAAAFAFSAYAPPRSLLPIAVIAALATVVFSVAATAASASRGRPAWPRCWSAWSATRSPAGCGCRRWWSWCPSIVPLLPGLSIYRGLYLLSEGGNGLLLDDQRRRDRDRAGLGRDLRRVRRPAAQARGAAARGPAGRPAAGRPAHVRAHRVRSRRRDGSGRPTSP